MLAICFQMLKSDEDRSEFEKLYNKYRNLMFYIAQDILKNHHLAEDAVSQTFIKLAENFDTILEFGDIQNARTKAYVSVSVKNTALGMYNKEHRVYSIDEVEYKMESDNELDELDKYIESESYDNIAKEFMNLPEDARHVLQSYAIFEHDINSLSKEFGISTESVKKKIYRARILLKKRLEEKDEK